MIRDGDHEEQLVDLEFATRSSPSSPFFVDTASSFSYGLALFLFAALVLLHILACLRFPKPSLSSTVFLPMTSQSATTAIFHIQLGNMLPIHQSVTLTGSLLATDRPPPLLRIALSTDDGPDRFVILHFDNSLESSSFPIQSISATAALALNLSLTIETNFTTIAGLNCVCTFPNTNAALQNFTLNLINLAMIGFPLFGFCLLVKLTPGVPTGFFIIAFDAAGLFASGFLSGRADSLALALFTNLIRLFLVCELCRFPSHPCFMIVGSALAALYIAVEAAANYDGANPAEFFCHAGYTILSIGLLGFAVFGGRLPGRRLGLLGFSVAVLDGATVATKLLGLLDPVTAQRIYRSVHLAVAAMVTFFLHSTDGASAAEFERSFGAKGLSLEVPLGEPEDEAGIGEEDSEE
jgi:hypothetical protein